MDIKIDQEQIDKAVNETATSAIADAFKGWQARSAIAEVITKEIADGAIAEAVRRALQSVDKEALIQHLATELQRATTAAVVGIITESMVNTIAKLRGISEYGDEGKKAKELLRAQLTRAA